MQAICVDSDPAALERSLTLCRALPQIRAAEGFPDAERALAWLGRHTADLALIETALPGMDGLQLAGRLRERSPDTAVIFVTGHPERAVEAFALHVSGYLLKPLTAERLAGEAAWALRGRTPAPQAHIVAQTFGSFDLFVDGKAVAFPRSKSKELLAYLVDRQGGSVTRAEAFAVLWEDRLYDRRMQKQLDVVIRTLFAALRASGAETLLEKRSGALRVRPEAMDCDLYRFLDGDTGALNAYRGEYMSAYSWASLTEAYMDRVGKAP